MLNFKKPTEIKNDQGKVIATSEYFHKERIYLRLGDGPVSTETTIKLLRHDIEQIALYEKYKPAIILDLRNTVFNVYTLFQFVIKEYQPSLEEKNIRGYCLITKSGYIQDLGLKWVLNQIKTDIPFNIVESLDNAVKWVESISNFK